MSFTYSVARTRHLKGLAHGKLEPVSRSNLKRTPNFCTSWLESKTVRHKVVLDLTQACYMCSCTECGTLVRVSTCLRQHVSSRPPPPKCWNESFGIRSKSLHVENHSSPCWVVQLMLKVTMRLWANCFSINSTVTWSSDYRQSLD
jgi:hypothetical protein